MPVAAIAALIAALSQSGVNIMLAVQQANALNAQPDITPDQWAAVEAACQKALDNSAVMQATFAAARAVALSKA